ncbi:MAG: alcohol dehydrogenase catalytic domain-containing protein [Pirellulaceae bacterium]
MKAVCFNGIGQVISQNIEDPAILEENDAIVSIETAGLCGSDLHPFWGREAGLDLGTVMGHEFVGTVVETGKAVSKVSVGDRVFAPFSTSCGECFYCESGLNSRCPKGQLFGWRSNGMGLHGGQGQFVRVPLANGSLMRVPDGLTNDAALLLGDNFSTGYFCAELAEVKPGGTYAVIGCGTVGLLCVMSAIAMGATNVVAIDRVPSRLAIAKELGASIFDNENEAFEYLGKLTNGRGADAVMELVGMPEAQRLAYRLLRPGGILSVIGCHCSEHFSFSPVDAYDKNLTYRTGRCPARHYMDLLSNRVAIGEFDLSRFITHRFQLDDCVRAYDVFSNRRDGCLKAVFNVN